MLLLAQRFLLGTASRFRQNPTSLLRWVGTPSLVSHVGRYPGPPHVGAGSEAAERVGPSPGHFASGVGHFAQSEARFTAGSFCLSIVGACNRSPEGQAGIPKPGSFALYRIPVRAGRALGALCGSYPLILATSVVAREGSKGKRITLSCKFDN